ncbi:MAG: hypothetical protein IKA99_00415 [Clostridia bacterium]|nr:hypothetical protein [Clostridia bacterium]
MKKIIIFLLTLVLSLSFIGCNTPTEESEPLVKMQEIQPAGTVNLAEELALFSKLLDNNYINVMASVNNNGYESFISVNARRTEKGYDAIVELKPKEGTDVWKIYYIDGVEIRCQAPDGVNFDYIKTMDCTFVDLIGSFNSTINSMAETRLIYHVLKPIIHKFNGFENVNESVDYANTLNALTELLKNNRNESVYNFVLSKLMGVDLNDEEAVAQIEEDILEFCSGNPSVAVFIDKIESYINTKLSEENKINIKGYLNGLQQASGVTTQEIVEILRVNVPAIADNLRAVTEGETLYDYLRSYLRTISLNAFTKNVLGKEGTFVDFVGSIIESAKNITVEYAYNWIISHTFIKSSNGNGNTIIGDHLNYYLAQGVNYKNLLVQLSVGVDDNGRPTKIAGSFEGLIEQSTNHSEQDFEFSFAISINYRKSNVDFTLPNIEG